MEWRWLLLTCSQLQLTGKTGSTWIMAPYSITGPEDPQRHEMLLPLLASSPCLGPPHLRNGSLWDGQRHILLGDKNQIHSLFSLLAVPRLCGSMSTLCICKALSKAMQTAIYPRHTQISICARLRGRHNQNKHGPCCQLWLFWLCQK
jgi:hypothetical protein